MLLIKSTPLKVDLGDEQFFFVKKLSYYRLVNISKENNYKDSNIRDPKAVYDNSIATLKACIVDWEGFRDEENNSVPFSLTSLEELLNDLDVATFTKLFSLVYTAIAPSDQDKVINEKAAEEIKNSESITRN